MKDSDCRTMEELILTDLDEGLPQEKRVVLERHVSECAACRKTWEDTRLLLSEIAADVPEDPGETFWSNYQISLKARLRERDLEAHLRKTKNSISWGSGFWWKAAGAFAVAGLVFIVVSVGVFQHHAARSLTDESSVSSHLISDLNQLYGPVLADEATYGHEFDTEDSHLTNSILAPSDDALGEWFEAEDEPSELFL